MFEGEGREGRVGSRGRDFEGAEPGRKFVCLLLLKDGKQIEGEDDQ